MLPSMVNCRKYLRKVRKKISRKLISATGVSVVNKGLGFVLTKTGCSSVSDLQSISSSESESTLSIPSLSGDSFLTDNSYFRLTVAEVSDLISVSNILPIPYSAKVLLEVLDIHSTILMQQLQEQIAVGGPELDAMLELCQKDRLRIPFMSSDEFKAATTAALDLFYILCVDTDARAMFGHMFDWGPRSYRTNYFVDGKHKIGAEYYQLRCMDAFFVACEYDFQDIETEHDILEFVNYDKIWQGLERKHNFPALRLGLRFVGYWTRIDLLNVP